MSDYISLAELQGMTDGELFSRWSNGGTFPFDPAKCGRCVTIHAASCNHAADPDHQSFYQNAKELYGVQQHLRPHLERIYALRLFYKHLYANNPLEIMDAPVAEESEVLRGYS